MAKILLNQYSSVLKAEMIGNIKQELAESTSCTMRKTFIFFCKAGVSMFSRTFFKENFLQSYIELSKDKVAGVRMEFASSLLTIKPFFDSDTILANDLISLLNKMHSDIDKDVVEAVETCDY